MNTPLTLSDIDARIAEADKQLADLAAETDRLSYQAVLGDAEASGRIAELETAVAAATRNRNLLVKARAGADRLRIEAWEASAAAARQEARDSARANADRLIALGERFDAGFADLMSTIAELDAVGATLRADMAHAGNPFEGRSGMDGVSRYALAWLGVADRPAYERDRLQPIGKLLRHAWKPLIEGSDADLDRVVVERAERKRADSQRTVDDFAADIAGRDAVELAARTALEEEPVNVV